jgi:hypothetical protein
MATKSITFTAENLSLVWPIQIAYTTSIPFNTLNTDIAEHTMTANDVFTYNTTGAIDNATASVVLINNPSYTPDLTAFHILGVPDNTLAYTYLQFFRKRGRYWVSVGNSD